MKIDPRQLANLLAVAECGSFNRAARARNLSQPALSGSIAELERRIGVSVLDRSSSGSTLNDFGKILVRQAQSLESLLQQAGEEVRLRKLGIDGPLRVGATPSLMLSFVPQIINRLLRENRTAAVSVVEGLDDQLLPDLRRGELDFILGPLSSTSMVATDITEEALFDDPFSIGVGTKHPLSRRRALTLAELREAAWILPGNGNSLRRHLEGIFLAAEVPWPSRCVTTTSLPMIASILKHTDHVTLITGILRRAWDVRSIPLAGAGARTIGIKQRRSPRLSPLALRLQQMARDLAQATI